MTSSEMTTCKALLKLNLEMTTSAKDTLLENMLTMAEVGIEREGITLDLSETDHQLLVVMYASWLYNKRDSADQAMPRMLRWQLNQYLFAEKMAESADAT